MKRPRFGPLIRWQVVLAGVVAASILHIVITLAVPMVSRASAYHRLSAIVPENHMAVLTASSPSKQVLPFLAPETRLAACRFDISNGAVAVTALLPERGWLLTLHTDVGDVFYAAPGQDVRSTEVKFRIVPAADRFFGLMPAARTIDGEGTTVSAPSRQGLVILQAPYAGTAFAERVETALAQATCAQEKPSP